MPSNSANRGVYFRPMAHQSRTAPMKLNLHAYEPQAEMRDRALKALSVLAAEEMAEKSKAVAAANASLRSSKPSTRKCARTDCAVTFDPTMKTKRFCSGECGNVTKQREFRARKEAAPIA